MSNQTHPYDRKHLKQVLHSNEAIDSLRVARDWAKSHLESVLIGALVVAAAVFGVVFFVNGQKQKALDAAKLLNEAQAAFQQAGSLAPAQAAQGFNQAYAKYQALASAYEGTPQAKAAQLGMANADLALGKVQEAQREYAALDSRDAKDPIAALAALGSARTLEAAGKGPEAAQAYAAAAANYPNSAVVPEALAAAERLKKGPQKK